MPVRIFGTDSSGQIFSEKVFTVNASRHGVELAGVQAQPAMDEIIGLTYGQTKGHFRVKWVGAQNTPKAGHVGLLNLTPEKSIWDFSLPAPALDEYRPQLRPGTERRRNVRMKCSLSVELHPAGQQSPIRAKATDVGLGGCFVEMPMPLPKGVTLRVALWVRDYKLWAQAKVASSTPGFGIGIQFLDLSEADTQQLKEFIKSITRI